MTGSNPNQLSLDVDTAMRQLVHDNQLELYNGLPITVKEPELPLVSVDIKERAKYIQNSLDAYSTASGRQGLINGILDGQPFLVKKYGEHDVDRFTNEVQRLKSLGSAAFRVAYGFQSMKNAGYDVVFDVDKDENIAREKFLDTLVGPGRDEQETKKKKSNKEKLRRKLKKLTPEL